MTAKISVLNTELVTGHCPECHLDTILVGIQQSFYRCTNCGAKKKGNLYGVSNYHKRTPKKRKGRISKKVGPRAKRRKKYVGQGR